MLRNWADMKEAAFELRVSLAAIVFWEKHAIKSIIDLVAT